ncbi:MAG: 2-oxo acid dehydrogenase subunit E2, partial [Acidimicrobiia bacterium]|nr:2-oxo acid dehydrogenase subunit E2 [Acidimicrobiia bacterium]
LTEATIISWYVDVGDEIGLDEPMVEVETDKAVVDIPSPHAGVLLHQGGEAGDTIAVESLLAVVGDAGEAWEPAAAPDTADAAPIVGTLDEAPALVTSQPGQVAALPKVRRLATELGVDLSVVTGSGVGGRITDEDVRAASIGVDSGPVERVPMSATRRAIAENMARSWREIPHVTTYGEVDAARLLTRRDAIGKPALDAVMVAAIAPLLVEHPAFNAAVSGADIVYKKHYDVGIAVDTPHGLMVAVIKDAAAKSIEELDEEVRRLAAAAKEQKLTLDELRGQTFTISNIGAVGGRFGTPLVPHGTSAILSIGMAADRPVVRNGEIVVGREFPLSLSYDHRIVDGSSGRAFMAAVIEALSV